MPFWEGRRTLGTPGKRRWLDVVALLDLVQIGKTALAGALAWFIATDVLGLEQAFLAPWAAVLVVHATVYRTVSRGGQQVVATFLGVFLAWGAGTFLGTGPWSMGAMLAVAYLLGRHRWLAQESTTIATTTIVVLATNAITDTDLLWSRLVDTSVGVVVGLVVNLLVWPPLRDRVAWTQAQRLPHELAGILWEIAEGLGPDLTEDDVEGWVQRCREADAHIDDAWRTLRQAEESVRFNPRRSRPAGLADLTRVLHLLEQGVADALSLARTVATSASQANLWDDNFRSQWQRLLGAAATALDEGDVAALEGLRPELGALANEMSNDSLARAHWHEYGGVLVNLRNIADASLELARWATGSGRVPRRSKRFEVRANLRRVR
jgi:uncharacterized membrane protein YccC